jgi:hypothetical protein
MLYIRNNYYNAYNADSWASDTRSAKGMSRGGGSRIQKQPSGPWSRLNVLVERFTNISQGLPGVLRNLSTQCDLLLNKVSSITPLPPASRALIMRLLLLTRGSRPRPPIRPRMRLFYKHQPGSAGRPAQPQYPMRSFVEQSLVHWQLQKIALGTEVAQDARQTLADVCKTLNQDLDEVMLERMPMLQPEQQPHPGSDRRSGSGSAS